MPEYLSVVLSDKRIEEQVRAYVRGATSYAAIRSNDFLNIKIPLPRVPVQREVAEKVSKMKRVVEGAENINNCWDLIFPTVDGESISVGDLVNQERISINSGDFLPKGSQVLGNIPVYGGNGIQGYHNEFNEEGNIISIGRVGAKCGCVHYIGAKCWITDNSFVVKVNDHNSIEGKFFSYVLANHNLNQYATVSAQPSINQTCIKNVTFRLPPLKVQKQIVEHLDKEMEALEKVRFLKDQAEKRIRQTLAEIWGEKTEENGNQ